MKPHSVLVLSLCILGALAQESTLESVSDILKVYNECRDSEGLTPCLKMKVLTLIDRVSRMEKLELMNGIVIKGKLEEDANSTSIEQEEQNLPRDIDAKSKALTEMIVDRIARAIGSKTIEISVPDLDSDLDDSVGEARFGDEKKKKKESKKEKKMKMMGIKMFIMSLMAKKLAMIPLYLGALFILAVKALAQAKIALLIVGVIIIKKLIASKSQGHQVQHASAGWSSGGGGGGGWSSGGSGGGWSAGGQGGGWEGGWDKRSIDVAHNIAYNGQKPT